MATAMALGEAAGVVAALEASQGESATAEAVRQVIRDRGGFASTEDATEQYAGPVTSSNPKETLC